MVRPRDEPDGLVDEAECLADRRMWIVDSRSDLSAFGRNVWGMTRHPRRISPPRRTTVYGEPIDQLLPALAAMFNDRKVLPAGVDSGYDQDMLSLSLTLPPRVGGSVGRAVLRSQAEISAARPMQ